LSDEAAPEAARFAILELDISVEVSDEVLSLWSFELRV
jgi:hypothetical protein